MTTAGTGAMVNRDRLLTVAETARALESTEFTIRNWIRDGRLEAERVGPTKRVRVRASVIVRLFPHINIEQLSAIADKRHQSLR